MMTIKIKDGDTALKHSLIYNFIAQTMKNKILWDQNTFVAYYQHQLSKPDYNPALFQKKG